MTQSDGILFLDLDGVLASHRINRVRPASLMRNLDPNGVAWINQICARYNLQIVIISKWRNDDPDTFPVGDNAKDYLIHAGITAQFHDDWKTGPSRGDIRGDDINEWTARNGKPKRMLILDDGSDFHPDQLNFLAQAHAFDGILFDTMQAADQIMLNQLTRMAKPDDMVSTFEIFNEHAFRLTPKPLDNVLMVGASFRDDENPGDLVRNDNFHFYDVLSVASHFQRKAHGGTTLRVVSPQDFMILPDYALRADVIAFVPMAPDAVAYTAEQLNDRLSTISPDIIVNTQKMGSADINAVMDNPAFEEYPHLPVRNGTAYERVVYARKGLVPA